MHESNWTRERRYEESKRQASSPAMETTGPRPRKGRLTKLVNIRKQPSMNSGIIREAPKGEEFDMYETVGEFTRVSNDKTPHRSYVKSSCIEEI